MSKNASHIWAEFSNTIYTVPSPRRAFVGLAPSNKGSSPPKLKYETLELADFLSNLNVKPLRDECKAFLLTTFWQRF